jgi:transcriptional regulator with PAS, ATPase and Fis domain
VSATGVEGVPGPAVVSLAPIIGESLAIRRAVDLAHRFAPTRIPILLVGPTGTGKELFAQHIHLWSGRRGELVDVNCAAIPRDLVEGSLFGHRRGAFSGAVESAPGLVEAADGGTLLLDEVVSVAPEVQAKLLRVLETGEVRRLGETVKRRAEVRIISAAQSTLRAAIADGAFRLDLYQRVAGVVINLPPLAVRGDDVTLLARRFAAARGRVLASEAESVLRAHPWPGNVRELAGALDRAARLSEDRALCPRVIREAIALGFPSDQEHDGAEYDHGDGDGEVRRRLLEACQTHGWDAARAASALAISRATLYRRLEEFGISLRAHRKISQIVLRATENS